MKNERKYILVGHYGEKYRRTAEELWSSVMEASKNGNFNWIAPASELVKVCKEGDFPQKYAADIKLAILKCYTSLERAANHGADRYVMPKEAVEYCYNSLSKYDGDAVEGAKQAFLCEVIYAASKVPAISPLYHHGEEYERICEDWCNAMFEDYKDKELALDDMCTLLEASFAARINTAAARGAFREADEKAGADFKNLVVPSGNLFMPKD